MLFGFLPFGSLLLLPLTDRFPAWSNRGGDPGRYNYSWGGGISPEISLARITIEVISPRGVLRQRQNSRAAFLTLVSLQVAGVEIVTIRWRLRRL